MARRFTTNDVISFPPPAAVQAMDGGPITIACILKLNSTAYSCPVYTRTSGGTDCWWIEADTTGTLHYNQGTGGTPRNVGGPASFTAYHIAFFRKDSGGTFQPIGRYLTGAGFATDSGDVTAASTLTDGSAVGAGGTLQFGRWGVSGANWSDMDLAGVVIWNSILAGASLPSLTTWTKLTDGSIVASPTYWAKFEGSTVTDSAGGSPTITGTTSVADPASFFSSDISLTDSPGGGTFGGVANTVASTIVLTDSPGGGTTGGTSNAVTQGVALTDTAGGGTAGGSTDAVAQGVALTDGPGGSTAGGATEAVAQGVAIGDGSGGGTTSGTAEAASSVTVLTDTVGGGTAGGSPDTVTFGVALADGSGGGTAGGSTDSVASADVTISDTSGGGSAGGSPDTAPSTVKRDTMVLPILQELLSCLQTEAGAVPVPPLHFQLRPGAEFENQADAWGDECCDGIGWVRLVANYEGADAAWIEPNSSPANCPPMSWAVIVELGIMRCIPFSGPNGEKPTSADWTAATETQLHDNAALRRVLCCIRGLYDQADVVAGQITPLPNSGGCGGVSMQVTIRADACDCG